MASYERMLDKRKKPTEKNIADVLGEDAFARLTALEAFLGEKYNLVKEIRFPFGNNYGWGYKYSNGRKHLCYAFFESGAFTVTLQLGDGCVARVEEALPSLTETAQQLWANRYPCGEHGGWIHYRVLDDAGLGDVTALVQIKGAPPSRAKSK